MTDHHPWNSQFAGKNAIKSIGEDEADVSAESQPTLAREVIPRRPVQSADGQASAANSGKVMPTA
jgi:hypothetical protein